MMFGNSWMWRLRRRSFVVVVREVCLCDPLWTRASGKDSECATVKVVACWASRLWYQCSIKWYESMNLSELMDVKNPARSWFMHVTSSLIMGSWVVVSDSWRKCCLISCS